MNSYSRPYVLRRKYRSKRLALPGVSVIRSLSSPYYHYFIFVYLKNNPITITKKASISIHHILAFTLGISIVYYIGVGRFR